MEHLRFVFLEFRQQMAGDSGLLWWEKGFGQKFNTGSDISMKYLWEKSSCVSKGVAAL